MDSSWIDSSPYFVAFITGLVGGVHCIGMCGGIVGMLSLGQPNNPQQTSIWHHFPLLLGYNLGRIVGYMSAGAIIAALGANLLNLSDLNQSKQILSIIAAVFMFLLGLYLAGFWNALTKIEAMGAKLWKIIEPLGRRFIPINSVKQAIPLGFIWGWLPCGLVYTILIMSLSAGSALEGALLMLAFGLGTLPNLLAMGVIANKLSRWTRNSNVRLVAGLLVMLLALLTLLRAFPL